MSEEYPLFPELSEAGQLEAQKLIDKFKEKISKEAETVIGDLYCDVACHIESDSWTNYRNKLMDGFKNYDNRIVQGEHDFKAIRKSIYEEFREELIVDLNQDLVTENKRLQEHIQFIEDARFK